MSDTEIKSFGGDDEQIAALQSQMSAMLLALLVVSATLATYLYYEQHIFSKDTAILRQQAVPMVNAFHTEQAGAEMFVNQIRAFGGTHPDFEKQVLSKYGIPAIQPANASAKPAAPVKK